MAKNGFCIETFPWAVAAAAGNHVLGPLGHGGQGHGAGGGVVGCECEGCPLSVLLKVDQAGLVAHLKDSVGNGHVQGH